MLTSLAVSDKRIPEWLSIICRLQNWGLVCWEAACLVWSPESCLAAAQRSWARVVRWKAKVASSLTDVWQQLFEQEDITVIWTFTFTPGCKKTAPAQQRLETPTETDTQEHVYQKPVREVNELKQHLIETWSATMQQSFIDRARLF